MSVYPNTFTPPFESTNNFTAQLAAPTGLLYPRPVRFLQPHQFLAANSACPSYQLKTCTSTTQCLGTEVCQNNQCKTINNTGLMN